MPTEHDEIRARLLDKAGLTEEEPMPSLEQLRKTQSCPEFEELRSNRMVMGAYRYGVLNTQKKHGYDNVGSIERRIANYKKTGNTENLVDIANLCMVEFMVGDHPTKHFAAVDDGEHVEKK